MAAVLAVLVGAVSFIAILWHRAVADAKQEVRDRDTQITDLKNAIARLESENVDLKNKLFEVQRYYIVDARDQVDQDRFRLSESKWFPRSYPPLNEEFDNLFTLVTDGPEDPDKPNKPENPDNADE